MFSVDERAAGRYFSSGPLSVLSDLIGEIGLLEVGF
jgi:hypothetical protein